MCIFPLAFYRISDTASKPPPKPQKDPPTHPPRQKKRGTALYWWEWFVDPDLWFDTNLCVPLLDPRKNKKIKTMHKKRHFKTNKHFTKERHFTTTTKKPKKNNYPPKTMEKTYPPKKEKKTTLPKNGKIAHPKKQKEPFFLRKLSPRLELAAAVQQCHGGHDHVQAQVGREVALVV